MFCGLLFSSSHLRSVEDAQAKPLVAQESNINITVVSDSGHGSADLTYNLEEEYNDLVFYVPHLIAHQGMTRQYVKLTRCQIIVTNINTGKTEDYTLKVEKLVTAQYSERMDILPSYVELKKRYKNLLSVYAGAHSSEDVLLHLGNQPAYCQLKFHIEFLMKFDFPLSLQPALFKPTLSLTQKWTPHWQYVIHNIVPTRNLSYSFTIASLLPIQQVLTPPVADELMWRYVESSEFSRNTINVMCNVQSDTSCSCDFSIIFAPGMLSGCYTCVTSGKRRSTPLPENDSLQQLSETIVQQKWDAIVMLNITLSKDQLPFHIQQCQLYPSEFLFVIDCSGSMSGTNIQSAADMLITCVQSLPNGSYFNIIAFGSHFRQLFHASEMYSKYSVERAVGFANQLQASLGGTELLPPLQWIFKKPRCGNLPRQLFIVTDGGVTNTQQVLNLIKRNRHQARCHTFGIGSEVCVELVTGIAAFSCGKCVLLKEGERLQTKVMEVLKESVQPTITNAMVQWNLPCDYTIIDSTPRSFHTMYVGNSYTAFAFLQKACGDTVDGKALLSSASISGMIGEDKIQFVVKPAIHFLSVAPDLNSTSVISQSAIWSKLVDLEQQAATCSRRKDEEPEEEKLSISQNSYTSTEYVWSIHKQLLEISLLSNIPTPLTYLTNEGVSGCRRILQILPYERSNHEARKSMTVVHARHKSRHLRRNHRHYHRHPIRRCHIPSSHASISLTSIAMNTVSNVSSRLKSMIGLFLPDKNPVAVDDDVQMLEDEVEYQEKKGSQLQLDDAHNLVYPSFYYKIQVDSKASNVEKLKNLTLPKNEVSQQMYSDENSKSLKPLLWSSGKSVVTECSSNEGDRVNISDTESDSSEDPDWEDLKSPSDLLPLIHMQLYSGAWPLIRPFSYAVGIPLDEIRKLPLNDKLPSTAHDFSSEDIKDEANFWSTALAVTCLEERFAHLLIEWELIAIKGRSWLERNQHLCGLTMDEVYHVARKLVLKQTL